MYILRELIQFLVMFALLYFWIENDIMKALTISILTTLIMNIIYFTRYLYRKRRQED